ncbi:MAG: YceD family protein [Pseudomonadota bacterium]
MIDHLPERLDLLATADAGRVLQGRLPLASMERVVPLLSSSAGTLQVSLELGKDPDGTRYLAGTVHGTVELQCQRCLEPFELLLDLAFRLGIVRDTEAAARLHARYEPLVVGAEPVRIADIVADEVLLALPLVPAHVEDAQCNEFVKAYRPPEHDLRDSPFAVLAGLKQKQ